MHHLLTQLGKDSVMFMAAKEFPLPIEYRFLPLEEVFHEAPADMADRTVDLPRLRQHRPDAGRFPHRRATTSSINIDHHHDNTRFGDVNLVDTDGLQHGRDRLPSSAALLGGQLTPEIASALYVGLVTDTGKFMYENTDAGTHRIAADLIEAGVEVDDTYRRLYEHVPIEKLRLVSRALDGIERHCDDRLVLTYVTAADYEATGAGEEMTEGIIDHLRSVEGAKVAALVRDQGTRGPRRPQGQPALQRGRRRRLRDRPRPRRRRPQARRRLLHRPRARGAGRVPLRRGRRPARLADARPAGEGALLLCDKPAGITSHDMVARVRRERGCKAGHAGTLDPFATGLLLVLLGRATKVQRFLTGLPKTYLATARLGWRSSTGDPDGELTETGAVPELAGAADRHGAPAGADDLGGPGRRRAPLQEGPPRRGRRDPRTRGRRLPRRAARAATARRARYEIECSAGTYIRTLVETLGDAYCSELRRTAIGPFAIEDAGEEIDLDRVGELVPAAARPAMRSLLADGRNIEVTSLPDAEPRPRQVAIGTFDGVHKRPPGGDRGRRHGPHLRPAPARGPPSRRRCRS